MILNDTDSKQNFTLNKNNFIFEVNKQAISIFYTINIRNN
jgi:hypothetical protein